MKRFSLFLFASALLLGSVVSFTSCVDDGEGKPGDKTGIKGKPSSYVFGNKSYNSYVYLNETSNTLSRIAYTNTAYCDLTWSSGKLLNARFNFHSPETSDPSVVYFSEDINGGKIRATMTTVGGVTTTDTIYVNAAGYPTRISRHPISEREWHYLNFTYDDKNRLVEQTYGLSTLGYDKPEYVYNYSYDDKFGSTSQVDCPYWFRIYYNFFLIQNVTDRQLMNYVNNLRIEMTTDVETEATSATSRSYGYDKEGYPTKSLEYPYNDDFYINY